MNAPLVSCIMPTADRRAFVPQAIRCFLGQDYVPRELLVVDDGAEAIADLVPADERIRYVRLETRLPIGRKRNYACDITHGEVIVHWDDDDWSAPWRVRVQVDALLRADADACGLSRLWFYDPVVRRAWEYCYPEDELRWVAGGTLCYRRELWRRSPFPDVDTGEDTSFVWSLPPARVLPLADNRFYVATVHARNTSPRQLADPRFVPAAPEVVESLLGADLAAVAAACGGAPCPLPPPARETPIRLNLGCCDALLPDYVNVDIVEGPAIQVADLRQRWPWADGSIDHVRAWDIIEHLPDKIFTMNELCRVLRPGGTAEIVVPTTDGTGAFQDPTHVSFWNRRSFLYYEAGNPYRERFAASYGITARFSVIGERVEQSADGPRLIIVLQAVKP
jgi:SAM-dependent methyltransferase